MKPFDQGLRLRTPRHEALTRRYEIARTAIEFLAALAFIVGSVLFFYSALVYTGTWFFLVGSVFFAVRPTIRLLLELHLARLPALDELEPAGD
ncbi:YrhK family protein [Aquibaculum sediminis]|uniref:YrhK family protein n=1 Tax=Aquibaculum sediminis TaxID=3231907 RepID=UPI0034513B5A